jgi:PTS system N-acetylgalactosamine-specific IIA component
MSELDLGEKLANSLQQDIPALYFTDLAGGTPFKEAIKISIDKPDVEVVSGCNLAALLETMFNDYDNVQAYAKDLVEITKKTADLADFSTDIEEENIEDGI